MLTRAYSRAPAVDVLKLVDAAGVYLTIGNTDAHGKNFSFLLDDRGPRLAPLYDLLSTIAWLVFSQRLALRMPPKHDQGVGCCCLARFADDAGYPPLPASARRGAHRTD